MTSPVVPDRDRLRADCGACVGLCCVGPGFAASADFAIDKPAGVPCPHLRGDDLCGVHDRLIPLGFPGCVTFDCFGAGQHVTGHTFAGRHWRDEPRMFAGLEVVRALHEVRWYLAEARRHPRAEPLRDEVDDADDRVGRLADGSPDEVLGVDVDEVRREVGPLLGRVADLVRAPHGPDLTRADLAGRRWRDLAGASLRGALLLGADLRGADLARADLLGADLRGADVSGADLSTALFLTRPQVAAARGDASTRLPADIERPVHWDPSSSSPPSPSSPSSPRRRPP